jgi:hypothetical protein
MGSHLITSHLCLNPDCPRPHYNYVTIGLEFHHMKEYKSFQGFEKMCFVITFKRLKSNTNQNYENEKIKVTFGFIELAFKSTSKIVGRINP